jgi:hypothetical protein
MSKYLLLLILPLFFTTSVGYYTVKKSKISKPPAYLLEKVYDLPEELSETSGIIIYDSLLWTFNDSGGKARIYGVNVTSGKISKTIEITNGKNKDWEDIAQNKEYIFIGDFGNNDGSRRDLRIYMIPKQSLTNQKFQLTDAFKIDFIYEDQEDFTPAMFANQYDCEAMIATEDSLYLFTKDWLNLQTTVYSLPASRGKFKAKHVHDFESEGLVTGADYNFSDKKIVLCGYNLFYPFIIVINNINDLKILNRIEFEEISGLQIEGIAFVNDNRFYVTNESSSEIQALYKIVLNNF